MSTRIQLVLGAAQIGLPGPNSIGARVNKVEDAQKLVDLFVSHGHSKIDTSRVYGGGTSEEFISQLDLHGCTVDTKVYPIRAGGLRPAKVKQSLAASIKALGNVKIQTFYLHAPDRSTPIEDTLRAVNELYKEGYFEEFGLSNFDSWEVAEVVCIARQHGWVKPTVYQGLYNVTGRNAETELLPCLRHFGIRFYAYSPLANGVLAGRVLTEADTREAGGRWDPKVSALAGQLHKSYTPVLPVFRDLKSLLDKNNITISGAALRWLQHHSALRPDLGDLVIIGASNPVQLESNLEESAKGPLPSDIIKVLDDAWLDVKASSARL
ncbi:hypothetical protein PAXRUDRAFT_822494 [Paxillus rubicundulus Ve08.2h10]|uniref:NADP-dependent oxidoreductase domain-containing protein n=1 Tax=Paxillus rubicundulus Ve08.2h10 TaxID=930991 RepID=A0A0D0DWD8_9AGAM|nr:hypothetical protein PAXRUDRAFT_822494 [Paxillus rubicundulus Ve08.2h10]